MTERALRPRLAIVGPTASGKSDYALDLIAALGEGPGSAHPAEVINADAFQFYRDMTIGTAKLVPAERRGIPHHQFDVLDIAQEASVAAYQRSARADAEAIEARGGRAVMVGGSGLYMRALTDNLSFPGTDPTLRASLEERLAREGAPSLWAELSRVDPASAERIEPANTRRLVRALEVWHLTGTPFSASMPSYENVVPTVHLGLRPDRDSLNARIHARAAAMFERGLLQETRALLERGLREAPTASRAIGYSQAIAVINGEISVEEAVESTALATRQLASRQIKWFRRDPRVIWLDIPAGARADVDDPAWAAIVAQGRDAVLAAATSEPAPAGTGEH